MQSILFSLKYLYQAQSYSTQSRIGKLIPTVSLNIETLGGKGFFKFYGVFLFLNQISIFNFKYF